jgi:putative protease
MQLINGKERLTLLFDCKPCEMHVVGKIKRGIVNEVAEHPLHFYRATPRVERSR